MTGCIYLACLIVTIAAVAMALQVSLPQISSSFQVIGTSDDPKSVAINAILLGSVLIVISTIINARGIKLLALINNIGVFTELIGIVVLIVLLFLRRVRSPAEAVVHFKNAGSAVNSFPDLTILLAATALPASYVLYGFDTAVTLAEGTPVSLKKTNITTYRIAAICSGSCINSSKLTVLNARFGNNIYCFYRVTIIKTCKCCLVALLIKNLILIYFRTS